MKEHNNTTSDGNKTKTLRARPRPQILKTKIETHTKPSRLRLRPEILAYRSKPKPKFGPETEIKETKIIILRQVRPRDFNISEQNTTLQQQN